MDTILINNAQNYLSIILNLNILLITANGFLLYKNLRNKSYANILLLLSILSSIFAICFIVYSYQELLEYLLSYNPNVICNFKKPFKILDWVFVLNISALVLTSLWLIIRCFWRNDNE